MLSSLFVASTSGWQRQQNANNFTLALNREYGRALFSSCRLSIVSYEGAGRAFLRCSYLGRDSKGTSIPPLTAEDALTAVEIKKVIDLVKRSNLYDGESIGEDATSTDGIFETLTLSKDRRTTVLVTSGNPSFLEFHPRRELLSELALIEQRLMNKGTAK